MTATLNQWIGMRIKTKHKSCHSPHLHTESKFTTHKWIWYIFLFCHWSLFQFFLISHGLNMTVCCLLPYPHGTICCTVLFHGLSKATPHCMHAEVSPLWPTLLEDMNSWFHLYITDCNRVSVFLKEKKYNLSPICGFLTSDWFKYGNLWKEIVSALNIVSS